MLFSCVGIVVPALACASGRGPSHWPRSQALPGNARPPRLCLGCAKAMHGFNPEFIHAEIQTARRSRDAMVVAGNRTGTNGRSTWRACVLFPGRVLSVDPGGVASISRGLSAATPPEPRVILVPTPEGSQRRSLTTQSRYFSSNSISALRSISMSSSRYDFTR